MDLDIGEIFIYTFVGVAIGYAFLASWTSLFYRKKAWGQLTRAELKIKQGNATLENRMDLFIRTLFASFFTYQVWLLTLFFGTLISLAIYFYPR